MADAAQDFLESGGASSHPLDAANDAPPAGGDPAQAFLESGGQTAHPLDKTAKADDAPSYWEQYERDNAEAETGGAEAVLHAASGAGTGLLGGFRYAMGADRRLTQEQIERNKSSLVYEPRTAAGQGAAHAVDTAGGYLGQTEGAAAGPWVADKTGSPFLGAAANTLLNVPQYLLPAAIKGARGGFGPSGAPIEAPAAEPLTATGSRATPFDIHDPQAQADLGIKPEETDKPATPAPAATTDQQAARVALFKRLGLKEVRTSAVTGDAQAAADDFDSTKYTDQPMGARMRQVIQGERQGLADSAAGIVKDTEARPGTDQSARKANGRALSAPMDALADHIETETSKAYQQAKAEKGSDPVTLPTLEAALKDPTLTNQLLAEGKENFLKATQSQLDHFKATNPDGLTVANAEQYRQFLNTLWKSNSHAVGVLKDALDTDVSNQVGSDVFAHARQLHQMGKVLLENPKGVADTFGKDPNTPANRKTAYEDIPDKLLDLDSDQFNNVLNTYRTMPPELQPQAQRAISVLQGHAVNRLADVGSKFDIQWNKKGVNSELGDNSENYKNLFSDRPDLAARIKDIRDGGEALRFNSSYRGAHAQASNMLRQGVGIGAEAAGTAAGAGLGTFFAGPGTGTIAGGIVGKYAATRGMGALDARAVRKHVESRVTPIP